MNIDSLITGKNTDESNQYTHKTLVSSKAGCGFFNEEKVIDSINYLVTDKYNELYHVKYIGNEYLITPVKAGMIKRFLLKKQETKISFQNLNKRGELEQDNSTNFNCNHMTSFSVYQAGRKYYIEAVFRRKKIFLLMKQI